ncbi:MAG TPA: PQQ-binding-like beta-propeller repeat protein, partial [Gemmataceae bacterium]|nr:PQQ-binding-like beta-propeller repeat protein [Gemmataceae bacterium]
EQRQKEAVPALIGLLGELPPDRLWQAEDMLRRLAGEKAPAVTLGTTESTRRRCRDAWAAWWQKNAARVDMARLDTAEGVLGLNLVVCYDGYQGVGRVWEFGPDRKMRWEITSNLRGPIAAVMIPGNHVLIAEYNGYVTERDTRGKVLWERQINGNPIACQRLSNGNTFVATLSNVMEITPQGREVYNHPTNRGQVTGAEKLRNGHIVYITMNGEIVELDVTGKEIRSFNAANGPGGEWFTFTVLPGGHYLVPRQSTGKVSEFDATGKLIREVSAPNPYGAVRLPNGHLMTCSMNSSQLAEVDRTGKVVWQEQLQGRPFMLRRR